MRVRLSTSVIFALGLLLPGCDEEVEDADGVAWNGGSDDDDGEGAGAASDPWGPDGEDEDDSWGDDSGEDPSGGDPSGGSTDPTGSDPSGGDPSGGDPSGGDPSGGDPTGGDPSGGDPTDDSGDSGDSGSTGTSPYTGGWDVGDCQASIPAGSGYAGDIAGTDQFGESVQLHDFCHKAVLVVVGTFT